MKKFFSIIALGAMTLSLSSFTLNSDPLPDDDCAETAVAVQQLYLETGHSQVESFQAADEYYNFCVAEGTPEELTDADLQ